MNWLPCGCYDKFCLFTTNLLFEKHFARKLLLHYNYKNSLIMGS
jgi:hypothetical protein